MSDPGWHSDPTGTYPWRWHDGESWTASVTDDDGRQYTSPMPTFTTTPYPASPRPMFTVQPVKPKASGLTWVLAIIAIISVGALMMRSSDSDPVGSTSDSTSSDSFSVDAQRLLMQNALDAANNATDQDVCVSIAILGKQSFIDNAVTSSDGNIDAWVAEDEITKRCG